jgi:hypothetical protein
MVKSSGFDDFGILLAFRKVRNPFIDFLTKCSEFRLNDELIKEKYDTRMFMKIPLNCNVYIIGEPKNSPFTKVHLPKKSQIILPKDEIIDAFDRKTRIEFTNLDYTPTTTKEYNLLLASTLFNLPPRVQKTQYLLTHKLQFNSILNQMNNSPIQSDYYTLELAFLNSVLTKDIKSAIVNYDLICKYGVDESIMNLMFGVQLLYSTPSVKIVDQFKEKNYQIEPINYIRYLNILFVEQVNNINTSSNTRDIMTRTVNDTKDTVDDTKDTVDDIVNGSKDTVDDIVNGSKDTVNGSKDSVNGIGNGSKDTVNGIVTGSKDTVDGIVTGSEYRVKYSVLMNELLKRKLNVGDYQIGKLIYKWLIKNGLEIESSLIETCKNKNC